jgi:ssDNA-binding Zn-finger/Zn-ribbon topoisomerase 1
MSIKGAHVPVFPASDRKCPIHHVPLEKRYGQFGYFWGCPHYPDCDITGSISKFDRQFRISTQAMRDARKLAHAIFDQLWMRGSMTRSKAYRWLSATLNIRHAHIEHLNESECQKVVQETEKLKDKGVNHANL